MKKLIYVGLGVLLVWNLVLTYLLLRPSKTATIEPGTVNGGSDQVINNIVNGYTTDITATVAASESKVVTIVAQDNGTTQQGSGVIYQVTDEGVYLVTNQHVVEGATETQVTFANGETLPGTLIGKDIYTDLAVLLVTPDFSVSTFTLGDSSILKKGEYVIAIGSPMGEGFQGSVSFGVLSNKDRIVGVDLDDDGVEDWDMVMLQTDAAINQGNSGGPLLNLKGDLIGITTMKANAVTTEGMGFAVPIDEVTPIVNELIENGTVVRPVLGISGQDVSSLTVYQKNYLGLAMDITSGVYVSEVIPDSPADRANVHVGDIILTFNDTIIESVKDYRKNLYQVESGSEVTLTLNRGGAEITVSATVE